MPMIELPIEQIAEFCQRWQITEFALWHIDRNRFKVRPRG
jgi:hypothetical protein